MWEGRQGDVLGDRAWAVTQNAGSLAVAQSEQTLNRCGQYVGNKVDCRLIVVRANEVQPYPEIL